MAVLFNDSLVLSNCIPWIQLAGMGEDQDCFAAGSVRENQSSREERVWGERGAVWGSSALVFEGSSAALWGLVQCDTGEMSGFSGEQLSRTFRGYE